MDHKIKNRLLTTKGVHRCMRVINDNTGEYHDVLISSGTNDVMREGIADFAHVLAGVKLNRPDKSKFEWTRLILLPAQGEKILTPEEANGETYVGSDRGYKGTFHQHDIDPETFVITKVVNINL